MLATLCCALALERVLLDSELSLDRSRAISFDIAVAAAELTGADRSDLEVAGLVRVTIAFDAIFDPPELELTEPREERRRIDLCMELVSYAERSPVEQRAAIERQRALGCTGGER